MPSGRLSGYASRRGYTLLDRRLFLPEAWFDADHAPLWRACGIPTDTRFQTKAELGAEMVKQVCQQGEPPAGWLVYDEWFGRNQVLLDRMGPRDAQRDCIAEEYMKETGEREKVSTSRGRF